MKGFCVIVPYVHTVHCEQVYPSIIFPSPPPSSSNQCSVGFIMLCS
jgi:hypothetical protein